MCRTSSSSDFVSPGAQSLAVERLPCMVRLGYQSSFCILDSSLLLFFFQSMMAFFTLVFIGILAVFTPVISPKSDDSFCSGVPSPMLERSLDKASSGGFSLNTTQVCGNCPDTGATRHYQFRITRDYKSPDGYNKSVILINDEFPGPLIEANWGDMIEVEVDNQIDCDFAEGTSIHWHGLLQRKSPWFDGVPGVSQCPISPGKKFTYTFQADQFGTTWYHSHFSSQYNDGLAGPIVIHGPMPPGVSYDHDLGPIMVQDYTHDNYWDVLEKAFQQPPVFSSVDANLINGRSVFDDDNAATWSKFNFVSGKTHRMRFINTGGAANQKILIDDHQFTVIANDLVPVVPYNTSVLTIGVGQRTDVIVRGTGKPTDAVWLRADVDLDCLNLTMSNPHALAAIYYEKADTSSKPTTLGGHWTSDHCRNDPLWQTTPFCPSAVPSHPATSQELVITLGQNASGTVLFFVNNKEFRTDYNTPVLSLAQQNGSIFPEHSSVYDFGGNESVRVIWRNTYEMQHPIHLHGHNFWVLAEGTGEWNGTITNERNPQRRDTHILQPGTPEQPAYVVLEWMQDNPGVWPMHCHTALHVSAGLYVNVLEQPEQIKREGEIAAVIQQTCKDWAQFSSSQFVDQIDSGV